MDSQSPSALDKIRNQFNRVPYMNAPLDQAPLANPDLLYKSHIATPYYLRDRTLVKPEGMVILDAGCGTGFKLVALAASNPGAKIVGIDLSEASIAIARDRLRHFGFEQAELHVLTIEDLPRLNLQFDYINCDEVLYLLPNPTQGLQAMQAVLKPNGIIRANLHSALQRSHYYRAQELFRQMGLMDSSPGELEVDIALETMRSLKDWVNLKTKVWGSEYEAEDAQEDVLVNYLLAGDKGFSIPDLFAMLEAAKLEFIRMVEWQRWELLELFQDPDNLPMVWEISLPDLPLEQRLHFFELLHPAHRLLDFWCGHPNVAQPTSSLDTWSEQQWQTAQVHLHSYFRTESIKQDLLTSLRSHQPFALSCYVSTLTSDLVTLESAVAACLLPLWEKPQPVSSLVQRWLALRPYDPITLEAITETQAFVEVRTLLLRLEAQLYVLLQP